MSHVSELILMVIVMSGIEAYCLYSSKQFEKDRRMLWYASAVLGYAIIVLLFGHLCQSGKFAIINSVWNAISVCLSIAVGLVMFSEVPSRTETIGMAAIVLGVVLTQIK